MRQAPLLWHNLNAWFAKRPLKQQPLPRHFLSILVLGERRALACKGPLVLQDQWVWRLKDWIDRGFMRRFQADKD